MRTADLDLLFVAGLKRFRRGSLADALAQPLADRKAGGASGLDRPRLSAWTGAIVAACERAERPVVFIAHSLGVTALAHAAPLLPADQVKGGFLVAPPSDETLTALSLDDFAPTPSAPLPFPSVLVASHNDPHGMYEFAETKALQWGSRLVAAGEAGHINADSGHGPWPEGLMLFAGFIKTL